MTHRKHEVVPTQALRRFLFTSQTDLKWWELAERDAKKRLEDAQRMIETRKREIADYEAELQYRQDHPEAER